MYQPKREKRISDTKFSKLQRTDAARTSKSRGKKDNMHLPPALLAELQRVVRKEVAKTEEVKMQLYTTGSACGSYNYTSYGSNQIVSITPYASRTNIAQGLGQGDRIGNAIDVKRARLRMLFTVAPYDVTTNPLPKPVYILWFIFSKKLSAVEGSSLNNFFQTGDSSAAPTGTAQDLLYDVNSDVYTVYKKGMVKLGYSAFVATPGGVGGSGYFSNNDYELSATVDVDWTSFIKRRQVFNDTTNSSDSSNVQVSFWTVNSDGSATSNAVYQANVWINNSISFTDA